MLKLKTVTIPSFTYRFEFPDEVQELGDGSERVFIEVEGRAGGGLNTDLVAGAEAVAVSALVLDKQRDILQKKAETDAKAAEKSVHLAMKNTAHVNELQFGLIYDACVINWRTNILNADTNEPLVSDRETFLALRDVKLPGFADFFDGLVARISDVSTDILEADKETEKN